MVGAAPVLMNVKHSKAFISLFVTQVQQFSLIGLQYDFNYSIKSLLRASLSSEDNTCFHLHFYSYKQTAWAQFYEPVQQVLFHFRQNEGLKRPLELS